MIVLENGCPQFAHASGDFQGGYVTVECVNKQLRDWFESLDRVYGIPDKMFTHVEGSSAYGPDTHTARLTKPVPIVRDSAEDVLEKIVKTWDQVINTTDIVVLVPPLIERARKLLDKGEK